MTKPVQTNGPWRNYSEFRQEVIPSAPAVLPVRQVANAEIEPKVRPYHPPRKGRAYRKHK
jgi:hypothetical protein